MSSQALKATVQQSVRMASQVLNLLISDTAKELNEMQLRCFQPRWWSSKLDTEEDLSGEPGLVTSTKVDSNKHRSNGGKCNKGRSGRVNSPKDLDGNISIRVVVLALSFQYCIPLMI